jgi:hypothetical protein
MAALLDIAGQYDAAKTAHGRASIHWRSICRTHMADMAASPATMRGVISCPLRRADLPKSWGPHGFATHLLPGVPGAGFYQAK